MSHQTDNSAKLVCGIGLLLLCCVAGCVTDGACLWKTAQKEATVGCDPYYGFRPTCWHPWPFCGAQPVISSPALPEIQMPGGDKSSGIDHPPAWETLPTPGVELAPPREPASSPPRPNDPLPPLPNKTPAQQPSNLPPSQPGTMPPPSPNSVVPLPPTNVPMEQNSLPPPQPNGGPQPQPNDGRPQASNVSLPQENLPPQENVSPPPQIDSSEQSASFFQSIFDAPACDQDGWPIDVLGECPMMASGPCQRCAAGSAALE
ncbi:MAG: hypothetical protein LLG00_11780 [Planctomycetaceae bacterium]|nr:hypothetical protein [Planctomycetaceae bacterium]